MNKRNLAGILVATLIIGVFAGLNAINASSVKDDAKKIAEDHVNLRKDPVLGNAERMVLESRHIFRFDTFGDEAFWGDVLQLHRALEGEKFGGVGPGVSPKTALSVGLKVDVDALPRHPLSKTLKKRAMWLST